MLYMMPGDAVHLLAGEGASQEKLDEISAEYGLDRPLMVQYLDWLRKIIFEHDFGTSLKYKQPVWTLVKARIPVTLRLTGITMVVQYLIAIPLGLLCAFKKDTWVDRLTVNLSLLMTSLPSYWIAIILMLIFAVNLKVLPLAGIGTWKHYVLPVASGVIGGIASTVRMTKSEALEVLNERYIATANAKGLSATAVTVTHELRNSLIVVCVNIFMSIPWLISGFIVLERVFTIPGMGQLLLNAIIYQDFNTVQCIILIITVMTVICNIISDIVLGLLDPRIRISTGGGDR